MFQYILGVIPIFHVLDSSIQSSWFCVRDSNCSNLYIRPQIHSNSDECLYNYCTRIIIKSLFGLFCNPFLIIIWSYYKLLRNDVFLPESLFCSCSLVEISKQANRNYNNYWEYHDWAYYRNDYRLRWHCNEKNCESNILTNCYWNYTQFRKS